MENSVHILRENIKKLEDCLAKLLENSISPNRNEKIYNILINQAKIEEDIFDMRIKKIMEMEEPYLPPITGELYEQVMFNRTIEFRELCEIYLKAKIRIYSFLEKLPPNHFNRTGYHWQEGHITLDELIKRYVKHDQELLNQFYQYIQSGSFE